MMRTIRYVGLLGDETEDVHMVLVLHVYNLMM